MEACDLLDTIHHVMEIDSMPLEKEISDARKRIRYVIYHDMYGWKVRGDVPEGVPRRHPPDPTEVRLESKAYIPPTEVGEGPLPFGAALDAPLG
jgi:hypothetical protein